MVELVEMYCFLESIRAMNVIYYITIRITENSSN